MKIPSSTIAKRLVFVTGDKGGVGKSFTARTLVQHNLDTGRPCHSYDIDPVNPSLHQYYPENTIRLNLEEPGALDQIRNDLEFNSLLLVDCAARSLHELDIWFRELGLLRQRNNLQLAVTFVFVITPDKSCTARSAQHWLIRQVLRKRVWQICKNVSALKAESCLFEGNNWTQSSSPLKSKKR